MFCVQRMAVLYHSMTLTTMNVFGIFWYMLQTQRRVKNDSDMKALRKEILFPAGFWKTLDRAKVGSKSVGKNVELLMKMCKTSKKEKEAEARDAKAPKIDEYY